MTHFFYCFIVLFLVVLLKVCILKITIISLQIEGKTLHQHNDYELLYGSALELNLQDLLLMPIYFPEQRRERCYLENTRLKVIT